MRSSHGGRYSAADQDQRAIEAATNDPQHRADEKGGYCGAHRSGSDDRQQRSWWDQTWSALNDAEDRTSQDRAHYAGCQRSEQGPTASGLPDRPIASLLSVR